MAEWEQNSALRDLVLRTREFQQAPPETPPQAAGPQEPPQAAPQAAGPQMAPAAPTQAPVRAPPRAPGATDAAGSWQTNPTLAGLVQRTQRGASQTPSEKTSPGTTPGAEASGLSRFRPVPPPSDTPMTFGQAAQRAAGNFGESFQREGGAFVEAVTSPIETAKGLLSVAQGAISKGAGVIGVQQDQENKLKDERVLDALVQHYKNAYGSWEAAKRYMAENPVAVLSDASLILTGGIGALGKAGKVAGFAGAAEKAGKLGQAAQLVDPINLAFRGTGAVAGKAGNVIRGVSSKFTGVPKPFMDFVGETFRSNEPAARVHAARFNEYLSGAGDYDQINRRATGVVEGMQREQAQRYQAELARINPNSPGIDLIPLSQGLRRQLNDLESIAQQYRRANGTSSNPVAEARVNNLRNLVDSVETHAFSPDPAMRSLEAIDRLKQNLNDMPRELGLTGGALGDTVATRRAVRDALGDSGRGGSPEYANLMERYGEVKDLIRTISDPLAFGRGSDGASAVRASMKKFKDPTYRPVFDELVRRDPELMAMLAGAVMRPYTRSGAVTLSELAAALPFWTIGGGPAAIAGAASAAAAGSPRFAGRVIQRGQQVSDALGTATGFPATQAARAGQMAAEAEREGLTAEGMRQQAAPIDPQYLSDVQSYDARETPYNDLIRKAAEENGIDPMLYKRLIGSESNFDPRAYALNAQGEINVDNEGRPTGVGIAQINAIHGLPVEQMMDPNFALPWAAAKFRKYLDEEGGNYEKAILRYKGASSPQGIARMMPITRAIVQGEPAREQRASGGKVMGRQAMLVDRLMQRVKQAHRAKNEETKPLLQVPDEAVASALAKANEAI